MKNVTILSTSLRVGSNSEILAAEFSRGAAEVGHRVERISLRDKTIQFCRGCLACQETQKCVIHDDMENIIDSLLRTDVIVFATPVYFYEMSGQMKTLLDRTNPMFPADYTFRDVYLLATAADSEENAMDGVLRGLGGWIACFEKAWLAGVVRGVGADRPGGIRNDLAAMEAAYQLGKNV